MKRTYKHINLGAYAGGGTILISDSDGPCDYVFSSAIEITGDVVIQYVGDAVVGKQIHCIFEQFDISGTITFGDDISEFLQIMWMLTQSDWVYFIAEYYPEVGVLYPSLAFNYEFINYFEMGGM